MQMKHSLLNSLLHLGAPVVQSSRQHHLGEFQGNFALTGTVFQVLPTVCDIKIFNYIFSPRENNVSNASNATYMA